MKTRKKGDLYPITATLKSNNVAVNLAGYTVTINIVDKASRAVKVANGACTITDAPNGKVSYQPIAADVNTPSSYDVEWKGIAPDTTPYHFPSSDYEPLVIQDTLG
jgi:hypothetical protein